MPKLNTRGALCKMNCHAMGQFTFELGTTVLSTIGPKAR